MSKSQRQYLLAKILEEQAVSSQAKLVELLKSEGIDVTQATLSRDLEELGAVKVRVPVGDSVYAIPDNPTERVLPVDYLRRVLGEWLVEVSVSNNIVVLRTPPGSAHVVASAVDRAGLPEIIGTVAGDDTVVLVAASNFFGSVFSRLGTPMVLTDFLLGLEINKYFILFIVMAMIFLLGWPLEWVPIVLIIIPIILPLIESLGFNLTWFAILVAVNLQTAWLSPPVALSAYFLKGVVPEWDLKDIYIGMMQFMVLQIIGLIIIIVFPKIVLWLPTLLYGQQ